MNNKKNIKSIRKVVYLFAIGVLLVYPIISTITDEITGRTLYKYCSSFPRERNPLDYSDIGKVDTQDIKISGKTVAEQTFQSPFYQISKINIKVKSGEDYKNEKLNIQLVNLDSHKVIWEGSMDAKKADKRGFLKFVVRKDSTSNQHLKGESLGLRLSVLNPVADQKIILLGYQEDRYPNGKLKFDGQDIGADLIFSITGITKKDFGYVKFWIRVFYCSIVAVVLWLLYRKNKRRKNKYEE